MKNNPEQTERQRALLLVLWVSMVAGIIFGMLGKNPTDDPSGLWEKHPQNELFLWISIIAFLGAVVFSYLIWLQVRAEVERKKIPRDKEVSSLWYGKGNIRQVSWLGYMVFIPGLCIMWIFWNVAGISHLEMFSWLGDAALLVAMVADIVGVVLMIKDSRKRARERKTGQQAS